METNTISTTTRPKTIEDLTEWDRRGHHVATVTANQIVNYPSLGQHLLAALAEAERLGFDVKDGEIVIPLTAEELEKKLEQKQRAWDNDQADYRKALAGEPTYAWRRNTIDAWAKGEALEPVNWDEVPVR